MDWHWVPFLNEIVQQWRLWQTTLFMVIVTFVVWWWFPPWIPAAAWNLQAFPLLSQTKGKHLKYKYWRDRSTKRARWCWRLPHSLLILPQGGCLQGLSLLSDWDLWVIWPPIHKSRKLSAYLEAIHYWHLDVKEDNLIDANRRLVADSRRNKGRLLAFNNCWQCILLFFILF